MIMKYDYEVNYEVPPAHSVYMIMLEVKYDGESIMDSVECITAAAARGPPTSRSALYGLLYAL